MYYETRKIPCKIHSTLACSPACLNPRPSTNTRSFSLGNGHSENGGNEHTASRAPVSVRPPSENREIDGNSNSEFCQVQRHRLARVSDTVGALVGVMDAKCSASIPMTGLHGLSSSELLQRGRVNQVGKLGVSGKMYPNGALVGEMSLYLRPHAYMT